MHIEIYLACTNVMTKLNMLVSKSKDVYAARPF